ncbi:DMP19 family protein [uncultured Prevotella sp.]|uniref:DMP19 family protein n=1 Tax=uncultured Prevotella sp. TaxID=159272 RepID=UPI00263352B2|nr:DMP19 family protein [uncultured Prevotella sp.]
MKPVVKEVSIIKAANEGMDEFINLIADTLLESVGGSLDATTMQQLNADQLTVIAYIWMRNEVMDGGFVQLIHNGFGGFIFENPFARIIKSWGLKELGRLIYNVKKLYHEHGASIQADCTDEEFMELFEKYPAFDDYDDTFVENEEEWTSGMAYYIDEHLQDFITIEK